MMLKLKLQYFGHLMRKLTHRKRLWCWEGLGAGGKGDNRGWDGWMASLTRWTRVWVNAGRWWWTGRPGMLWFMGSQRVGHDWATELNWTESSLMAPIVTSQCVWACQSSYKRWIYSYSSWLCTRLCSYFDRWNGAEETCCCGIE